MAIKTQGTKLYVIDPDVTGGPEVLSIDCVTGLSGLGGAREQIDVTCLESEAREFTGGLSNPAQLTANLNFDPSNASHLRIFEMWRDNKDLKFAIGLADGVAAPTIDTAGEFEYPTTRSFLGFEGYIVDLPIDLALNSVVTSTIPIQVSGLYNIYPKTT